MGAFVHYKNHAIYYEIHSCQKPSKEYILLIHGFLASQYCFRHMIPKLSATYNIICMDIPPFGNSSKIKDNLYTYDNMVDAIFFLLNQLNIHKITVLGHSMGGQIAIRCGYRYANRIKELFLLSPCCFMKKSPMFTRLVRYNPLSTYFAKSFLRNKGVREVLRQCIYNDSMITPTMIEAYKHPFEQKEIYPTLLTWLKNHQGDLHEQALKQITLPITIFWGKSDLLLPYELGYHLLSNLQNAKLILYENVGHLLPEEIPQLLVPAIIKAKNETELL